MILGTTRTSKLLWLLEAGDGLLHLAFEPDVRLNPMRNGYLVLPAGTQLNVVSADGCVATCPIGDHVVLIDVAWLEDELLVDLGNVSQDITADIMTLTDEVVGGMLAECAGG